MKRAVISFFVSFLVAYLLMSIVGTQIVLSDILSFGLVVPLSERVTATGHDIVGLFPALPILVFVSLLASFLIAALAVRFLGKRRFWYMAAGFLAVPVALLLIKSAMGGTLFAAARTITGMLLIAVCGMISGWLFARLTAKGRSA